MNDKKKQRNRNRKDDQKPPVPVAQNEARAKIDVAQENRGKDRNCHDRTMAIATVWSAVANCVVALFAVVGSWFLSNQLKLMQQSNLDSNDSFQKSQRAFLIVDNPALDGPIGDPLRFNVRLMNTGAIPAERITVRWGFSDVHPAPLPTTAKSQSFINPLPPNAYMPIGTVMHGFPAERAHLIEIGKDLLWCVVTIDYGDANSRNRERSVACWRYVPATKSFAGCVDTELDLNGSR